MKIKKRKKTKRKRIGYSSKKVVVETPEEMRQKFPEDLVKAFVAVSDSKWEDDSKYKKYRKLADKYLGNNKTDPIEAGKLVVNLARATMDIRAKEQSHVKKKTKKIKKKSKESS